MLAPQIKITIPEGFTAKNIAERLKNFINFNEEEFLKITENKEGRLFPDTYFFSGKEESEEILKKMEDNFKIKAGDVSKDTLIMASIIEKEAHNKEDRRIISGILWKRLKINMPLQVDVSLYTYDNRGFPPTPICNPGLDAIDAALNPADSKYWYYLSDKKGATHFARTFEEHKQNKARYGI